MSGAMPAEAFTNSLFALLTETFESSPQVGSIYLDRGAGLFDTLSALDAERASREVLGTTIAAHLVHTSFYLRALERYLEGFTGTVDWAESWTTRTVTPEAWRALVAEVREEYERVSGKLRAVTSWGEKEVGFGLAIIAHTAYHLGAIRQLAKAVRGAS